MKKSYIYVSIITLAFSFSCSEEKKTKPDYLIPKEKFIPLTVDLKVLEEHYHRLFSRPDVYSASLDSASHFIFEDYGTSRAAYEKSTVFYCQDVHEIYALYEAALDTINLRVSNPGDDPLPDKENQ